MRGANADLWSKVWQVLHKDTAWTIAWMPSHQQDAEAAGVPALWFEGNQLADDAAKRHAASSDMPQDILQKWTRRQEAEDAVMKLIAESQVQPLAERPRLRGAGGVATKTRKRKAPMRPQRVVRRRTAQTAADAAQQQLPQDEAQPAVVDMESFCWPRLESVPGVHDMIPAAGPHLPGRAWPTLPSGAIVHTWRCRKCSKTAHDSSRLLKLLRTPCGLCGNWNRERHDVGLPEGHRISCRRCGTTRQKCVNLGAQLCPVHVFHQGGAETTQGTELYRAWVDIIKRLHAAGKSTAGADAQASAGILPARPEPSLEPAPLRLRSFRSHCTVVRAGVEFCLCCFSRAPRFRVAAWRAGCCDGIAPIGACPKYLLEVIALRDGSWPPSRQARDGARGCCESVAARPIESSFATSQAETCFDQHASEVEHPNNPVWWVLGIWGPGVGEGFRADWVIALAQLYCTTSWLDAIVSPLLWRSPDRIFW